MWQDVKNMYHLFRAVFANISFGFPSKNMTVIGVTGTDGKTTTSHFIYHILKSEGLKVALVSTVSAMIDGKEHDTGFHVTTPDSFQIQKYLSLAKKAKCEYVVLEVTSHALDQNRVHGIHFNVGVVTNISHEHLDYHKTYEKYVRTKFKLLARADSVLVNKDDKSYRYLTALKKDLSNQQWHTYGLQHADLTLSDAPFVNEFPGEYNWYNGLAGVSVGKLLGISFDEMKKSCKTFRFPKGRLDLVYDKQFKVYVDFAHTPNSIKQVLQTLNAKTNGRLIHVFGSAGQRDSTKRPLMGKASSDFTDITILTAEDPRSESVEKICRDIRAGMVEKKRDAAITIPDRQTAINAAIDIAQKGDTVVVTGKGHEQSMNFGMGEVHWSDYEAVEKALKNKL